MASNAAPRVARAPLNEIIRSDGKSSPAGEAPAIAAKYAANYDRDGNAYRSARFPEKIEFVDRRDRMHIYGRPSEFTVRAMVETAKERGWESLEVQGPNPVWKSMVYVEAAKRAIEVKGYQPSDKDNAKVERHNVREEAKQNPMVQAFAAATTAKQQTAAVKKFPELGAAFALQKALQTAVSKSGASQDDQQSTMDRANDRISRALHQGKDLPQLEVRTQLQINEVERD